MKAALPRDRRIAARCRSWAKVAFIGAIVALFAACTPSDPQAPDGSAAAEEPAEDLDLAAKPDLAAVLTADRGDPPASLTVSDLVEGGGDVARAGDIVTVHFVGAPWSSGAQFDATWDRGQPYTFVLGAGEVIQGWDLGVEGMRVGGRRVLIVPPDLAYEDRGAGTDIAAGETLAFIIDLLEVAETTTQTD